MLQSYKDILSRQTTNKNTQEEECVKQNIEREFDTTRYQPELRFFYDENYV
jgi:hypothetical protein